MNQAELTMRQIHKLAQERFELYKKAGHKRLSDRELRRLSELTATLDRLWHQYREELAGQHRELPQWLAEQEAA